MGATFYWIWEMDSLNLHRFPHMRENLSKLLCTRFLPNFPNFFQLVRELVFHIVVRTVKPFLFFRTRYDDNYFFRGCIFECCTFMRIAVLVGVRTDARHTGHAKKPPNMYIIMDTEGAVLGNKKSRLCLMWHAPFNNQFCQKLACYYRL